MNEPYSGNICIRSYFFTEIRLKGQPCLSQTTDALVKRSSITYWRIWISFNLPVFCVRFNPKDYVFYEWLLFSCLCACRIICFAFVSSQHFTENLSIYLLQICKSGVLNRNKFIYGNFCNNNYFALVLYASNICWCYFWIQDF